MFPVARGFATDGKDCTLIAAHMDIQRKVRFLKRREAYPEHPAAVSTEETHMSWLFLTDRYVYKLKKPVRQEYLDFSTLEARHEDCKVEVELNRRLAPDVYLGVVPLTLEDDRLSLDGEGEAVDWLVKMRRLPAERMLSNAIGHHRVREEEVRRFARVLAEFYQGAAPVAIDKETYCQRFAADVEANAAALSDKTFGMPDARLAHVLDVQRGFLEEESRLIEERVEERRIIEGHGDLRPEHICMTEPPVIIDCLEFNRGFRIVDPADELAFLAVECEHAGAGFIGEIVFDTYRLVTGDSPRSRLVAFYKSCRAMLRAKLAAWHLKDYPVDEHAKWLRRAGDYLCLAEVWCRVLKRAG